MATLVLETPEGVRLRRELAGAGSRGAAAIIDALIFFAGFFGLAVGFYALGELDPTGATGFFAGFVGGGFFLLLVAFHTILLIVGNGRTPGKFLLGLRVVDQEGLPATPVQYFLRSLLLPIEMLLMVPIPIGLTLIAVGGRRQRLGDHAAGTLVLSESPPPSAVEPFPKDTWEALEHKQLFLSPAITAHLSSPDRTLLRQLLARRELPPGVRADLMVRTADSLLGKIDAPVPEGLDGRGAHALLRELYLYLRRN